MRDDSEVRKIGEGVSPSLTSIHYHHLPTNPNAYQISFNANWYTSSIHLVKDSLTRFTSKQTLTIVNLIILRLTLIIFLIMFIISPPNFKINIISFDDVQFKALIPRQGNHLIRDFSSLLLTTQGFQPV